MAPNELAELTPLVETLNAKSDEVNQTLALLNQKLAALNVGVEVWVGPWEADVPTAYQIGYAKVGETWQLVMRTCDAEDAGLDRFGINHEWVAVPGSLGQTKAILQASRSHRIGALEALPNLLAEMKSEVQRKLDAIEHAKQLAAEL